MRIQIIGRGRMGMALERALRDAGVEVLPTLGRAETAAATRAGLCADASVVLLAVPDAAIAEVASLIAPGRLVGHLSGITTLAALHPHEAFGLHPLLSVVPQHSVVGATPEVAAPGPEPFTGAFAAVDGTSLRALATAREIAGKLGMQTFRVADADRAAYHAAASISANFLVVLEGLAERLAETAGVPREALVPLADAALRNWAERGAAAALTGPVVRGDEQTIALQREAVAARAPEALSVFDSLVGEARNILGTRDRSGRASEATVVVRTIAELRAVLAEARRATGATIGFVPTMGALHEGHLSLLRAARAENQLVVLSVFVNPTQFTEAADLAAYPRQEAADLALAERAGVDVVFAPDAGELYPEGFVTTVSVTGPLATTLEGVARGSAHFDGVATVVSKLLIAVGPDAAYFGQKDAQQLLVVRRTVADLGLPVRVVACPTLRDADGLALSSRNQRLSAGERSSALAIPRALEAVRRAALGGETDVAALREAAEAVLGEAAIDVEYLAFVDPETLSPLDHIGDETLCAVAARVGEVRLIDNVLLTANTGPIINFQHSPNTEER